MPHAHLHQPGPQGPPPLPPTSMFDAGHALPRPPSVGSAGVGGGLPPQPPDGVGLLISAFDSHHPGGPPPNALPTPQLGPFDGGAGGYFASPTGPLGPANDGFEGELQFYLDGPVGWASGPATGLYDYT